MTYSVIYMSHTFWVWNLLREMLIHFVYAIQQGLQIHVYFKTF